MPQYIGSTTPLAGNAVFTSAWVPTDFWLTLTGAVFSDQSGSLEIDQSSDGVNVDTSTTVAYTGAATTANTYSVPLVLSYVRLKYTNGATPQTAFRLGLRWIAGETPV